jgi:hypothetical protein
MPRDSRLPFKLLRFQADAKMALSAFWRAGMPTVLIALI